MAWTHFAPLGAALLLASSAFAVPFTVLPATGMDRDYMNLPVMFDGQPTWDGTKPIAADNVTATMWTQAGRVGFIDLGANYADLRIAQTWTQYNQWSTGNMDIFSSLAWVETFDTWNWSTPIPEPLLKLSSQTNKPYTNESAWFIDGDFSAAPLVPQGRYIMLQTKSADLGQIRACEFALIGYVQAVPEPTSLGFLAVGGLLMLKRRPQ